MERREIRFEGLVQGVFFRATTRRLAGGFDITGWVRNEPDGAVTAQVQGESGEIERFLEGHRVGRPGRVDRERSSAVGLVNAETGFEIRR